MTYIKKKSNLLDVVNIIAILEASLQDCNQH